MASISMAFATRCIKNACGEGECFDYTSVSCIKNLCYIEDFYNGGEDSYREGDDDDDSDYDYAPAA
ncbi:hypothetical protein A2U01_0005336 [Trifolium medium]|uniref:Uncharacterized protein n=1 Tax=Trifolium medium TaxID=97028 RepID=A0A392MDZ1_9FABA|nr:hypothetical protein [Trifolium medium]MCH84504.1 hypothetical protein [Trifolium medium]